MAIYEGLWDCQYCGSSGNRGSSLNCPQCGVPRDKDVRFYLPGDAPAVSEPTLLKKAAGGPDWHCPYCGKDNPSSSAACSGCGASADGTVERRAVRMVGAPAAPRSFVKPARKGPSCWLIGCIALLVGGGAIFIALMVLFGVLVFNTHDEILTVTGHEWTRSMDIERYQLVTREAWEGSVPRDAEVLSSRRELYETRQVQTGTRRVKTGTRDRGNGFFEDVYEDRPVYRDERVYRNKITYRVWDWVFNRTLEEKGNDDNPRWPPDPTDPNERVSKVRQKYKVHFVNEKGDKREHETEDSADWARFRQGEKHKARVNMIGGIMSFGT